MKTAMVWGAGGGIGRALVSVLKAEGWIIIAVSRTPDGLDTLTPHVLEADVQDPRAVEQAVYAAAQQVDGIDLWIYAVGDILAVPTRDLHPSDWHRILDANLSGAYVAAHFSLPLLAEDAHLVFLGGISERLRLPGLGAYAAAKAGLEAYAETLAKEERRRRVTVVRPSAVDTRLWDKVPMCLPKDAPPPEKVAHRILEAHLEGHKGQLDLAG